MPLDFFVWLLRGGGRNILVDTGFNAQSAASRGRVITRCPIEALRVFGLAPEDITDQTAHLLEEAVQVVDPTP